MAAITAAYQAVPVGDPALPGTFVGPVVSAAQKKRVLDACDQARRDGAEILVGGDSFEDVPDYLAGGHFVQPTVIIGVDPRSAIAQQEIFGPPVLVVLPFRDDEEAIRIANDSAYGLAGAVLSGSLERGHRCGAPDPNRLHWGGQRGGMFYGADAPFGGGYKSSGVGRQCGIEGFGQYLETKTLAFRTPRQS